MRDHMAPITPMSQQYFDRSSTEQMSKDQRVDPLTIGRLVPQQQNKGELIPKESPGQYVARMSHQHGHEVLPPASTPPEKSILALTEGKTGDDNHQVPMIRRLGIAQPGLCRRWLMDRRHEEKKGIKGAVSNQQRRRNNHSQHPRSTTSFKQTTLYSSNSIF